MSISFSSNGSTANNPTKGLSGNPAFINQLKPQQPITGFNSGTQPKILGSQNLNAPNPNGTPTAAGNASLQGADYFKGLLNSSNPAEVKAGQTWLSHQTNPGLLATSPLKKTTTTSSDGTTTTHEFHAPDTKTTDTSGGTSSTDTTKTPTPTVTTPQVGTPNQNAQHVLDVSGGDTAGQGAANASALFGAMGNIAGLTPYAGGNTQGLNQSFANLSRPQSTGNLAGEEGLFNTQNAIFQNAANTSAAQALANKQIATGGAENVLGASIPSQISGSSRLYNPLAGAGADSGTSGIIQGANNQTVYDLQQQYNQGKVALNAADGIKNQILGTLQANPSLNSTPLSGITNLNELISGQISSGPQQLLSQQIASYINTLGLDPATVTNIAHQQQGTLATLLDSLRNIAQAQNEAKNPVNLNTGTQSSTSGGSTGGGYAEVW